jgi:urocanate hydratase
MTDQTSAHDPINGCRRGWTMAVEGKRESDPKAVEKRRAVDETHVAAMVDFWNAGVPALDYGSNIRQVARWTKAGKRLYLPGFVLASCIYPPLFYLWHRVPSPLEWRCR